MEVLRLISPEEANRLGLPSETPVLISSSIKEKRLCEERNVSYTPLIFQVGYTIEGQHFYLAREDSLPLKRRGLLGFVILIEPLGKIQKDLPSVHACPGYPEEFRSEQIRGIEIKAFCHGCYFEKPANEPLELQEGFVFSNPDHNTLRDPSLSEELLPICNLEKHPEYISRVRYYFRKFETGEILFSTSNSKEKI